MVRRRRIAFGLAVAALGAAGVAWHDLQVLVKALEARATRASPSTSPTSAHSPSKWGPGSVWRRRSWPPSARPPRSTTSARSRFRTRSLAKPGPLDDGEWTLVRQHPGVGEQILSAAPALARAAALVRASHERFDGGGYPDGLRGARIPLGAR